MERNPFSGRKPMSLGMLVAVLVIGLYVAGRLPSNDVAELTAIMPERADNPDPCAWFIPWSRQQNQCPDLPSDLPSP